MAPHTRHKKPGSGKRGNVGEGNVKRNPVAGRGVSSGGNITKRSSTTGRFVTRDHQPSQTPRVQTHRPSSSVTAKREHRPATSARSFLKDVDALAARISAAWKDDMSAVDAVNEQRD